MGCGRERNEKGCIWRDEEAERKEEGNKLKVRKGCEREE